MKKFRVIVCGTNYGKFYLSAFLKENSGFHLAGILAKGSERSSLIADEFGVTLFKSVDEIPETADIACVAVKSTILGGSGTRIAMEFLKRGIHVIQEHPVHPADIHECLKLSKKNGVCYHINSHFVHVKPVKTFIDYVQKSIVHEQPLFIDASTALIYSTIDIIGQALGKIKPFEFNKAIEWSDSVISKMKTGVIPFKCIQGVIAGVPVTFKLQNYYDPDDMDHNYLIMHRICIGSESGNTTLFNTHGPLIWTQGYPFSEKKSDSDEKLEKDDFSYKHHKASHAVYSYPTSVLFSGKDAPAFSEIIEHQWPEGILSALNMMRKAIETGLPAAGQSEDYLMDISEIWLDIMKHFGKPQFIKIPKAKKVFPDPIKYRNNVEEKY